MLVIKILPSFYPYSELTDLRKNKVQAFRKNLVSPFIVSLVYLSKIGQGKKP